MSRLLPVSLTALLIVGACSEGGLREITEPVVPAPVVNVQPSLLEFGIATSQDEVIKEFMITNLGTAPLHIHDLVLTGQGESYSVLSDVPPILDADGGAAVVQVAFRPVHADQVNGTIQVLSDDSFTPAVAVDLVGEGHVPWLKIDPPNLDFGVENIGCVAEQTMTLSNVGNEPLEISALDWSADADLRMLGAPALPLTISPGGSTTVDVVFEPLVESVQDSVLSVVSNDPRGEVLAGQIGEGAYEGDHVEEFDMPVAPPVDILFAVDQSCSMKDDATRLTNNFSSFVAEIDKVTTGWQVGVATADNGCFRDGFLDRSRSGYQSLFQSAVLTWRPGSYTEALLTIARNAVSATKGGCNTGFLRPEALLHIILVSDEPEQSRETWSSLVNQIQGMHPTDPSMVKISAVAGDYPGGCGSAQSGQGYWQAVNETGGEYLSICDTDWARHVEALAKASIDGLGRFELAQTPDPQTLEVFVDSVLWNTGWHLEGRDLVFDATPPEGARIRVSYNNFSCR
ncbi:MAG: choice-of-anchor D domain-containing protein [Myxococcota bacterium]